MSKIPDSDQRARPFLIKKKKKITQIFPSIPQCKLFMGPDCVETLPIVSLLSNIV